MYLWQVIYQAFTDEQGGLGRIKPRPLQSILQGALGQIRSNKDRPRILQHMCLMRHTAVAAVTCLRLLGGSQLDCMKHASAIDVCHSMEVFVCI